MPGQRKNTNFMDEHELVFVHTVECLNYKVQIQGV